MDEEHYAQVRKICKNLLKSDIFYLEFETINFREIFELFINTLNDKN